MELSLSLYLIKSTSIDYEGDLEISDTLQGPLDEFGWKSQHNKKSVKSAPTHTIINLHHINLDSHEA